MTTHHKIAEEIAGLIPKCSFGDIRTLSRRADRSCQDFPDDIASQIHDRTAHFRSRIRSVTACGRSIPSWGAL
jgi:hypothetical protein